jgi:hypothetical protein
MIEYDPGPPADVAGLFARAPDYGPHRELFWYSWGPIFYRGRLDRSARVLCVASDPGPTERIALRTLVGDAGQRVQGMLAKVGLTRSYVCLNAFVYALIPSQASRARSLLRDERHVAWRNELFSRVSGDDMQAIVAFGVLAQAAVKLWEESTRVPVFNVPHPSSRDQKKLLDGWRAAVEQLRRVVTPDQDGDPTLPNYGDRFDEADYQRIPHRDLPFGLPEWFGDDSWGRRSTPRHHNCVRRPVPDDRHTLIWIAPKGPDDVT